MEKQIITYSSFENVEKDLIPNFLNGNVFHVTQDLGYQGIIKDKFIKNNKDGNFEYIYGQSKGNYGTCRGYVCLFDLRDKTNIYTKNTDITYEGNGYHLLLQYLIPHCYIFILKQYEHCRLIDWTCAKARQEQLVNTPNCECDWYCAPYYECWYPKDISLDSIEKIIELKYDVEERMPTSFAELACFIQKGKQQK